MVIFMILSEMHSLFSIFLFLYKMACHTVLTYSLVFLDGIVVFDVTFCLIELNLIFSLVKNFS